jgi:glycosyltransferase involved in cell wall biosynthesis
MTSIVIAAHDEATVIGRCLDALLDGTAPGEFDITVVANGCTDATALIAAERTGVRVLDLPVPGKVGALNAGDAVAAGYPRIYLDADIVIPVAGIRALRNALSGPGQAAASPVLAATVRREMDVSRSPLLVRAYFAINSRLPIFQHSLFGRGVIALSEEGRRRFDSFPDVVADDLYLDSLFRSSEKAVISSASSRVVAPRRTHDLVRRLVRVRRGNASMRAALADGRPADVSRGRARSSWLRDVVLRKPTLIPAAVVYATITVIAAVAARRPEQPGVIWERDNSSRLTDGETATVEAADGRG